MGEKTNTFIAFLVGLFFGRYGVPLLTHLIYLLVITLLLLRIAVH